MAYSAALTAFAQSVYLTVKGRYFDDIDESDGQVYISQVVDWLSGYLDELETTTDASGVPVYWNFARTLNYEFGNATVGESTIDLDDTVLALVANIKRPVRILDADGKTLSEWTVVSPSQLGSDSYSNMVASVGGTLFFSRTFRDAEDGGTVIGDVTSRLTRPSATNDSVISTVKPRQLLVLGVAKNSSLPDIVQGGLSPTFLQRYNDLLQGAILINNASADSDEAERDDRSDVGGVGF